MEIGFDLHNVDAYITWLDQIKRGTGDARPLWTAMRPVIIEYVNDQFNESSDAGKGWRSLSPKYKEWKVKHGFSGAIGVRTGALKWVAGEWAIVDSQPTYLKWKVRNSGAPYAPYFDHTKAGDPKRPVYKKTVLRINNFLKTDIANSKSGVGFTYNWLKKSLEIRDAYKWNK